MSTYIGNLSTTAIRDLGADLGVGLSLTPETYGAVGDNATNDTAAIQAAEDAATALATSLGCPVELRFTRRYAISASIVKKANVHWTGRGLIRRIDNAAPTGATFTLVTASAISNFSFRDMTLENVSRDVEVSASLTNGTYGFLGTANGCFDIRDCTDWSICGVRCQRFTVGIRYEGCSRFQITDCVIDSTINGVTEAQFITATLADNIDSVETWTHTGFGIGTSFVQVSSTTFGQTSSDFIIGGNLIRAWGLDNGISALSQVYDENPGIVSSNVIIGGRAGIQIYRGSFADAGTAPTWDARILVFGNHIRYCLEQGIYLRAMAGYSVTNNWVQDSGITASGSGGAPVAGIMCRVDPGQLTAGTPSALNDNTGALVAHNHVVDCGGVAATGGIWVEHFNCRVQGNMVGRATPSAAGSGIVQAQYVDDVHIVDNTVIGFAVGIDLGGVSNIGATTPRASVMSDVATFVVRGNLVRTCPEGIKVEPARPGGQIINNTVTGSTTAAITLRQAPYAVIEGNQLSNSAIGIRLASGSLASDLARLLSRGTVTNSIRRGGSLIVRNNRITQCTTPHTTTETSSNDAAFHGRTAVWEGDTIDGVPFRQTFASGTPASTFTAKTWNVGDFVPASAPASAATPGRVCTAAGTYGATTTTTGDTTNGSPVITNVANLDGYGPGIYITATGFSGVRRIIDISVSPATITVDANATSSNTSVALTVATPTFAAMANLA